jgi:peptidoglycan/LPS O-acetylase OafA/YrhL
MPAAFSLYLDALRFGAAILVVLAHYVQHDLVSDQVAAVLPYWGREAVMVFFVLSGFVIAYTTEHKAASAQDYVIARCARIYSVALPLLLLSFAAGAIALYWLDAQVSAFYALWRPHLYIPFHLLFMGEMWSLSETPPWMPQYWSLGYEVWYYVLFGCAHYLRGWWRYGVTAAVFMLLGPKLWLLLPVWLSGVALYHGLKRWTIPQPVARAGLLLSLALLLAFHATGAEHAWRPVARALWPFPGMRMGSADRFLSDYVVCLLVVANFACARFAAPDLPAMLARPIRGLSAYTFTLYLAHELVISCWRTFHGHDRNSIVHMLVLTALIAGGTWLAGQLTERRKHWFRTPFEALFNGAAMLRIRLRGGHQPLR